MWEFLEILHIAATIAVPTQHFGVLEEVPLPVLHQVAKLKLESGNMACTHEGLVIGYDQDWTEERQTGDGQVTIIPPSPGELEGYGILVNTRTCADSSKNGLHFTVGEYNRGLFSRDRIIKHRGVSGRDVTQLPPEQRPRWLPQVMRVLEEQNGKNPVVTEFMASLPKAPASTGAAKMSAGESPTMLPVSVN